MRGFAVFMIWISILLGVAWLNGQAFQVQEDSPQWNCWTMGNRVCGATLVIDEIHTALLCTNEQEGIVCHES
jgi:hypothetical protein